MHRLALLYAASLMVAPGSSAQTGQKSAASTTGPDKQAIEQYVRHLFVWGPQIQVKVADPKASQTLPGFREVDVVASAGQASQAVTFYLSPDGTKLVQGNVFDLTRNPFQADLAKIVTDLQPSFGTAGAPVVVVMYSDFQCSFCRDEAKIVRENIAKAYPKEVRVYFKDFPLEQIHPWAKAASVAGRCIFRQKPAAFWAYHDWIFEHQAEITPENLKVKIEEFAKTQALEPIQLGTCTDTDATAAEVEKSMAEARALGVNSTPTLFVNGRRMVGQTPWPQLKAVIDHEIEYAKTHGGGEKCCEVTLPSPTAR